LIEVLVGTFVLSLVSAGALGVISAVSTTFSRLATESDEVTAARLAMDEMTFELRGANQVLAAQTLNGVTFTTGGSTLVFSAPGYDPATAAVFLGGVTDYVAFQHDAAARTLSETLVKGAGSVRPDRNQKVIARSVESAVFTYRVRDQFTAKTTGLGTFTLSATPQTTPVVYINGSASSCTLVGKVATVTIPSKNADVKYFYTDTPCADTLPSVTEVDLTMTLQANDSRNITRTLTLSGGARLRNLRL
jgi:hypothetical protein